MKTVLLYACLALAACRRTCIAGTPSSTSEAKPPFFDDILRQCNVKDQDSLDQCLYHVLDSIRPFLHDGIPEWHVPSLEPLAIQGVSLNQGSGNTRIRASFDELKVTGLSNYTITYVRSSPAQYKFSIGLQFPKLNITGKYDILGNLLLIPIKGRGPFWADFKDVKADSYNWLEVEHPHGDHDGDHAHAHAAGAGRLRLSHTQTDFDIGKVQLRLEHLFNDDEFLGETVNNCLNENAPDIIRELKPQFAQEIDRLVTRIFSEAVGALPVAFWESLAMPGGKGEGGRQGPAAPAGATEAGCG